MIAARDEEVVRRLRQALAPGGTRGEADAWPAEPARLALLLGTAAHALDFDDHEAVGITHPSAVLVAAILALGATEGCSGQAAIEAYIVGYETIVQLGAWLNPSHYALGWHATATIGALAAAAACGRLIGLSEAGLVRCLSLAASMAAGSREQFGSPAKPLHAGFAGRAGIEAALWAAAGLGGAASALDGRFGIGHLMTDGSMPEQFVPGEDPPPAVACRPPIVKRFPSCAATHRTLDQLLEIRSRDGLRVSDVQRITTTLPPFAASALPFARPATVDEARFSMAYCAAALIEAGSLTLGHFTPAALQQPRAHAFADLLTVEAREPAAGEPRYRVQTRIELTSGRVLECASTEPVGAPEHPLTADQRLSKFLDCVGAAASPSKARALAARILGCDGDPDPRRLLGEVEALMGLNPPLPA